VTHPIRRRDFIALSATVGAGAVVASFGSAPASAASSSEVLGATVGFTEDDRSPLTSSLTRFGEDVRLALDYNYRSVGADLGSPQYVDAIELVAENAASRLNSRDLSVYASQDNVSWTKLRTETVDLGGDLWLYGLDTTARYVKVHCHRGEQTGFTFVINNMQTGLRVHRLGHRQFVGSGGGVWRYKTPVLVRNANGRTLRDRAVYVSFAALGVDRLVAAGQLAEDLRDLRFADAAGNELHAYADGSGVFVRIPEIHANATVPIFAYSGNPDAVNRVTRDVDTLQVQYGNVTLTEHPAPPDALKTVRLPDGTMMVVTSVRPPSGLQARFSRDGGRTWSGPEQILAPSDLPNTRLESPSGYIVDPETGVLTFVYLVATVHLGGDYMDPTRNNVQTYVVQAASYTSDGRPVFGTPRHIPLRTIGDDRPVSWGLTYTSPIRTRSGAYVLPISYMIRSDGTFALGFVRSTDRGRTWVQSRSELTVPDDVGFEIGVTENGLAQLSDGRILLLARQQTRQKRYFALSQSFDDGRTWTPITDSTVLASNTQPTLIGGQGKGLTLTFSGHNAFGQTSYARNDLTVAYSDDDGRTWQGYHNLIGATALATPGWFNTGEIRRVVNADSAPAATGDRVFAWSNQGGPPGQILLVEDFDVYLRDSHGALDVISYRDAGGASRGVELAQSRWWRTLRAGILDLVPGSRAGRQAVRLRSTPPNETAATRQFPAIQQGTVRFALRWTSLGSGLRLSLQEAYGDHSLATGTVLALRLTPAGELLATTQAPQPLPVIGYLGNDIDPAAGNLASFGTRGGFALDYQYRSIGADMFAPTEVTGVQLVDDDVLTADGNRIRPDDLRVWVSDTNAGDWRALEDWIAVKEGPVITITGPAVTTRYIKVSQPYGDTAFTFGNDVQHLLRILPDREAAQVFHPLPTPARLAKDDWHLVELHVDLALGAIAVSVDGVVRGRLAPLGAAGTVAHLLAFLEQSSEPSEIAIDELLVRDTARGLPGVALVGPTTPA
jgi:hypothetical protein